VQDGRVELQIQKMREDVEHFGESILTSKEVTALCQNEVVGEGQWNRIAKIAISEDWSFTFYPDGRVRFAKL
jgi:hypothetical protein